jgi:hypothetical protein
MTLVSMRRGWSEHQDVPLTAERCRDLFARGCGGKPSEIISGKNIPPDGPYSVRRFGKSSKREALLI